MGNAYNKGAVSDEAISQSEEETSRERAGQHTDGAEQPSVIGIGASAGGLKALQSFFSEIPGGTNIVFVVVVHLSPDRESNLAEILASTSSLAVQQVQERTQMQPGHVYIIPPGKNIDITDGHLALSSLEQARRKRTPIDHFFRTLAYTHPDGIGVLLSGGGSDGTVGMKDIKEQGGLLMVQEPAEAQHDAMPRNAIGTGLVDFVLPARELAQKVVELTKSADLYQLAQQPEELPESDKDTLEKIFDRLREEVGHDFSGYKRSTMLRRLQRRMRVNQVDSLQAYLGLLEDSKREPNRLFQDLLISVTGFFRDPESWEVLEQDIIPELFADKTAEDELRVWVPGCATGEEAYSLAMLVLEHASTLEAPPNIQVFACDLDEKAIATARYGVYPETIRADVSKARLKRFFYKDGEHYRVRQKLRDAVLFAPHNLLKDPPFSRQELIACRNLLIYLQRDLQEKVLGVFHYALNPGGYLFLGNSESADSTGELFQAVNKKHRIYARRRLSDEKRHLPDFPLTISPATRRRTKKLDPIYLPDDRPQSNEELHGQRLEEHAPPSILIDETRDILHVSETANRYLSYPAGLPTYNILQAVRQELRPELRTMLLDAFDEGTASTNAPIEVQIDGEQKHVHLIVRPAGTEERSRLALVLFAETDTVPRRDDWAGPTDGDDRVRRLATELDRTKERLHLTAEEYETSEAELKVANEELQSINEEYKTTVEELETSQEELQSVNEELQTVNTELNNKVDELSRANNDLKNLMASTDVATVFLNRELQIERFTPQVEDLFNVMERDRGRPLDHVTHKFVDYGTMVADAEKVLDTLVPVEREVQDQNDRWYLVRILPYRTVENRIEGIVVTFVDITRLRETQERARYVEERHRLLLERVKEYAIFTMDENGIISTWNPGAERIFGYTEEEILGRPGALIFTPEDRAENAARQECRIAMEEGQASDERWHLRKNGERFWGSGIMTALYNEDGALRGFAKLLRDNTERRKTMNQLKESREKLKALNETLEQRVAERTAALEKKSEQVRRLASELVITEQHERHRIAQVLHDDLQQHLYSIQMKIAMLKNNDGLDDLHAQLDDTGHHLEQTINRTRNLTVDLSPPVLKGEGLVDALEWLVSQMSELHNLRVEIDAEEAFYPAEEEMRVLLFQVVRELLFNVVKHAGTERAAVELRRVDNHLRVRVSDDGRGCDPEEVCDPEESDGFGLPHLRQRIELFGGEMNIDSAPDEGTTVEMIVPVEWQDREPE